MVGFGGPTVMACAATSALPSASPRLTIPNRMKGSLSSRALLGCIIREIPNARWSPIFRRAGLRTRDCAGLKDEDARSSGRRGRSQGAPSQVDDDVLGADRRQRMRRLTAGASDHQDFRVVEELLDVLAHQRRDVGDLLFDVATIGPDQLRERDARVEDSNVASLADECLRLPRADRRAKTTRMQPRRRSFSTSRSSSHMPARSVRVALPVMPGVTPEDVMRHMHVISASISTTVDYGI